MGEESSIHTCTKRRSEPKTSSITSVGAKWDKNEDRNTKSKLDPKEEKRLENHSE